MATARPRVGAKPPDVTLPTTLPAMAISAPLADAPQQPRLDRRRRGVDVMAVEAEAGFEPQRIAGTEPNRLDLRLGEQLARDRLGPVGRRRDLVAIAAGIAR